MTDASAVAVNAAFAASTHVAGRFREDPGEYVGVAWEAATRALARGRPANPDGMAYHAARQGATGARIAWLRLRNVRRVQVEEDPERPGMPLPVEQVADRPYRAAPEERVAALWDDGRDDRAGWPPHARVWAYLYAVEGWRTDEIAAAVGCSRTTVVNALARVAEAAGARGAFLACGSARGQTGRVGNNGGGRRKAKPQGET